MALAALPNLPDPTAPDEDEVLREVGEAGAPGRNHLELLGQLVDMEAGARVAGSRFVYLKGPLVRLEFALVQWALDLLEREGLHAGGAARARARAGALRHRLPARHRAADLQRARGRPLPGRHERGAAGLAPRRRDPRPATLPLRYAGFSPCFRREAGAAGKDTQGHLPRAPVRQGRDVRVRRARRVAGRARAAAGDRGGDPGGPRDPLPRGQHRGRRPRQLGGEEVRPRGVAAGQERYRELTSCSNTTDFQARRLDVRYRPAEGEAAATCTR